jgi:hypothetical protein
MERLMCFSAVVLHFLFFIDRAPLSQVHSYYARIHREHMGHFQIQGQFLSKVNRVILFLIYDYLKKIKVVGGT